MPSSRRIQRARVMLTMATVLLFCFSSTFLLVDAERPAYRGLSSGIALVSNQEGGNYTYQTTLTSFMTVYNTTTSTQITYLTSSTLITVSSTILVPTTTIVTKTQILTSTERSVTTTLRTVTLTRTSFTNVTNTQTVTTSAAQTTTRTTETTTETSTKYTIIPATSTLTELTTLTSLTQGTQTIAILTNPFAEVATALLILVALATLLAPRIRARRFVSRVCPHCGYSNPRFAHSFCIKCGSPLEAPRT